MIDQRFTNHYDINNPDLNLVMDIMRHPQKESAKLFLCMINDVMNYYMSRIDDEVRFPLLYVPSSEPWAHEICVEFVTLKLALLYNNQIQRKLSIEVGARNAVYLPAGCNKRKRDYLLSLFGYNKKVYQKIKDRFIPESNQKKNLLICDSFDASAPENKFLDDFCGNEKTICDSGYAVTRSNLDFKKLDRILRKDKGLNKIENFFIFLARGVNGRFTDAYSFDRNLIGRFNKLGLGVKNTFYFYFSTKPYKLQRQLTWKFKNAVDILHEDPKDMRDFISFSSEETDYIFGRKSRQITLFIEPSEELESFKTLVDDSLEACEYNIQVRNNLAVCYEEAIEWFRSHYADVIDDIDTQYFDIFFQSINHSWEKDIFPAIALFLQGQNEATVILDYYMPEECKKQLISLFGSYGVDITTETFKSLKYKNIDGIYCPNIAAKHIIVMSYQGHYIGRPYSRYPNSFDPFCLRDDQMLINIINKSIFDPYYSVHNYEYYKTLKNVLSSDYRKNYLKCGIQLPSRPTHRIEDSSDRTTSHTSGRSSSHSYQKNMVAVNLNTRSIQKFSESDYVICKENNEFSLEQIILVSSLHALMQECEKEYLIFPLAELHKILIGILEASETEIREEEMYIRRHPQYALTDEEVLSDSELWEILLSRKVGQLGADVVYQEIMDKIPYSERIKRQSFERWYTPENDMILPRSRRMQEALLQYLVISAPYDKIIRRKKAQKSTKTEQRNSMIRTFLCNNL